MGRNGIMGSFQGFDAFGKVGLSPLSRGRPGGLADTLVCRPWKMSRSGQGQELSVRLSPPAELLRRALIA